MSNKIIFIESAGKIKKITEILDKKYIIKASFGHVEDLDKKTLSIDIENNFTPIYVINSDKTKLKNSITSVNWNKFIYNDTKNIGDTESESNENNNFVFVDDAAQEYEELIAAQASTGTKNTLIIDNNEEIDIDDI